MNRRCKAAKKGNARGCHAIPCPLARLLAVFLIGCLVLDAQEASPGGTALSGLALDNFNRVGASAAAIEAVLRSDPGLMVELKRWVAKEATDQGRIVEDTALTDQGIFDRLAWDLEFRSIATRLLQRYGHLLPRLNPESEAAKEQELVRQQRVRRLLAAEESGERADWRGANAEGVSGPSPNPSRLRQPSQRSTFWPQRTTIRDGDIGGMGSEGNAPGPSIPPGDELVTPGDPPGEIERRTATPMLQAIAAPESATARGGPLSSDGADFSAGALLQTSASLKRSWNDPLAEEFFPEAVSFGAARSDGGGRSMAQDEPGNSEKFGEPAAKLRPNPFSDIPSLFDLYRQVSPRQKHIERFGAEVFRNGPRELDLLPMDLPVGPDYVVGPGDGLTVELWGSSSGRLFRTVDAEGRLALPEVGPLLVSGRTLGDIQQSVQQVLRTQFRDISADVSLSRLRTVRVYVVGDVERPGAYDISSLSTPLNALFQAGGPTERGSLRLVRHYREGTLVQEVDLYDLLLHGVKAKLKR
ncbi:MAG TPA: polysaccharide biosynthesis/export family protein, partial [Terriglobia bacterium]|nr:polysaccharide biosynthesis/export family protein [Terriglobia bacterium]